MLARRYFGWTTTRFNRRGMTVRHYRRYGKKTYRTRQFYKPNKLNPFFTGRF